MIERADQLILNYVSKAADAAHGVLRPEQRLDFTRRLRARIEAERHGSQNARQVSKVLARFGDPVVLVEREMRRLAESAPGAVPEQATPALPTFGPAPVSPSGDTASPARSGSTAAFPRIVDDAALPPGVARGRRLAERRVAGERGLPFARLRSAAMSSANPMATGGRDARTVVKHHPREVAALVILVVAALMVPFDLPAVAIFRVPVIVWAFGAVLVMMSDPWALRDRLIGIGAPLLGYTAGGVVVGGLRVGDEPGLQAFVLEFFNASGVMFMIGTGAGVAWLVYRLIDADGVR
ncbi:hypothetical protein [Nonomuraea sp. LPB2021202275-12-8]|uniref:hypothetical protein n=1 Tax=Nonomuraea sp. LPB2021202275-12-8 TaxID=3120159 RepID=UPI00300C5BE7